MPSQRRTWLRVQAPKAWHAKPKEELIGTYIGNKLHKGQYGDYLVHFIKSRSLIFYVSGSVLDNLFSLIPHDMKVKLIFKDYQQAQN